MHKNRMEFYSQPDDFFIRRKLKEYKELYIRRFFPDDRSVKVLDLGCGYGLFLAACQLAGYKNCEGVEIGEDFVDYSREKMNLKCVTRADVFNYLEQKNDETYDVITALNIVEHIETSRVQDLIGLIYKKIKRGGIFIMEVPNADSPIGIHTFFSDLTHKFAYTKGLVVKLLSLQGFGDIKVLPDRVRSNLIIRLGQKILAKIVGFDDKLMFSGNIIVFARRR